ncbi:Monothiol glutaredoxin-S15, partial [Nymphaea thermarum]
CTTLHLAKPRFTGFLTHGFASLLLTTFVWCCDNWVRTVEVFCWPCLLKLPSLSPGRREEPRTGSWSSARCSATSFDPLRLSASLWLTSSPASSVPLVNQVEAGVLTECNRKWYASMPDDPDSHDDFQPKKKIVDSASLKDIVENDVKSNPVMIYMKGVPDAPRCGFSALAVRVLQEYGRFLSGIVYIKGIPLHARNILEDSDLKNSVKAFSNWPTFPQIFIKGEFIGGSDIILNMHQSGELKEKLKDLKEQSDAPKED